MSLPESYCVQGIDGWILDFVDASVKDASEPLDLQSDRTDVYILPRLAVLRLGMNIKPVRLSFNRQIPLSHKLDIDSHHTLLRHI
jgi:hypothetical protein